MFKNERIFGFFIIGILSSAIDIGLLYVLTSYLGIWYLLSATVSYCCGIVVSYLLNKCLTFHDANRHYFVQFSAFAAISFSCLLVNICIIWLCVELFSLGYLPGKIIATGCSFFWNYYGQSRITFHPS
ncbi:GtrA family protein [uncultured Methanoregula sp.]|uniref:GtrA family protein n=1 Tax=uncultured Methanoregula sp. TaxID=1005933 RepID=UPI00374A382F